MARIARFIEAAMESKPEVQASSRRLADRRILITLGLGFITFAVTRNASRLASVFLIDHACTLRLGVPVAIESAIDLTVPTMPTAGTATEPPWLVDIGPDGLRLAGEPVSSGVLAARVNDRLTVIPDQRVLVRPAAGVPLQDAVDVLGTLAGAGGPAGTEARPEAGTASAAEGGGTPGAMADYMAALRAWLERHKRYRRAAQLRRQEGVVLLSFVMDRNGRVLAHRLQQSSGNAALDRKVEALIQRAQPLPPLPATMAQARLEVVVPIRFALDG